MCDINYVNHTQVMNSHLGPLRITCLARRVIYHLSKLLRRGPYSTHHLHRTPQLSVSLTAKCHRTPLNILTGLHNYSSYRIRSRECEIDHLKCAVQYSVQPKIFSFTKKSCKYKNRRYEKSVSEKNFVQNIARLRWVYSSCDYAFQ